MKLSSLISLAVTLPLIEAQTSGDLCPLELVSPKPKATRCGENQTPTTKNIGKITLSHTVVDSVEDCAEACFADSQCKSFQYADTDCTLFSRQGKLLKIRPSPSSYGQFYNKHCFYRPTSCPTLPQPQFENIRIKVRANGVLAPYYLSDPVEEGENPVVATYQYSPTISLFTLYDDGTLVSSSGNTAYTISNSQFAFPSQSIVDDPDSGTNKIKCTLVSNDSHDLECVSDNGNNNLAYLCYDPNSEALRILLTPSSQPCVPVDFSYEQLP